MTTIGTFEQNMRILDLAFDYLSVNPSEKEKIVTLLEKKFQEHSDINLTDIFRQENLISDEGIEYFRIFDTHLQTLCLDEQFGRLAVANGLVSEQDVSFALECQQTYFEKYRINMKIGDIWVENKTMTHSDRVSILLTQNRIKDENLLDALNDIGATLKEKDAVSKRFGVLAIKKELVSIEQVKAALEIQKNETRTQGKSRFMGRILQETAELSDDDILQVLLEQKQFEKRRLDLEKALYTVQSEIKISQKLNKLFEYRISKDGIEVFARKLKKTDKVIPVYEFHIWLKRAGIKFGIEKDAVLEEFIQKAEKNIQILVAKGYPSEQCTHESIQFYFENEVAPAPKKTDNIDPDHSEPDQPEEEASGEDDSPEEKALDKKQPQEREGVEKELDEPETGKKEDRENNKPDDEEATPHKSDNEQEDKDKKEKENNGLLFVEKGSLLARIIPGKEGKPGKDVLGYPIQPGKPSICIINAGSGVIKKGLNFFALVDGRPVLKKDTIHMVEPVVEKAEIKTIRGGISNDTNDIYESASVELFGTITPEAVLKCRSLLLHGNLLGCVICTGDIDVKGDIGTDEKPKDKDTIRQTGVVNQGSVKASKSIINAKIQTAGELLAFNSMVIGSEVIAFKGMSIRDVFKGEHGPSILQFGLMSGDKILAADHSIETKIAELSVLKKEPEINALTEEYRRDLKKEENHQIEQAVLKNFIEIIKAPELFQHEGLEGKIKYLYSLPDFSSIKAYYLKLPETEEGLAFRNQIMTSAGEMPLENFLNHIKKKIDPEPSDETASSKIDQIETQFKARLSAFEIEMADKSEEIEKLENEIKGLKALREKLGSIHANSLSRSMSVIKIKNKCEKGTIIKGKIARLVIEKTLYNVKFKEVMDPKTNTVSITIEMY